ncbi:Uncharacterized lipoprotein YddW, UPF0748 family [Asanoa hainanensis]|uniref:Uncharacterized lipoprotein YddW, UPF0748 family n=1 Tax=Asanoa hainanensis TaxID=560556 RepID=A0A239LBF9_9ACTN|nr:Uncharacterized lipoprotein YddW, UPF0748 family [Asanoa hainanensis]
MHGPTVLAVQRRLLVGLVVVVLAVTVPAGVGLFNRTSESSPDGDQVGAPLATCDTQGLIAKRELRGMWLTTVSNIDFPSKPGLSEAKVKDEYRGWLDLAEKMNHNAVFVHVRPSGDAFWPSAYAPWSEWLTGVRGKDPGWDPLAWMIEETHARNLEFHAWFNPYRGSQPATSGGAGADFDKLAPDHPLRKNPDWAVAFPEGTANSRFYFDPGNPAARAHVEDAILDAVNRYAIDGVHFDDFFYPYPEGHEFNDDASYARYGNGRSRGDWRRANVDTFVEEISQKIHDAKPWVRFGLSPFGIWRNKSSDPAGSPTHGLESYEAIYADTRKWVRKKWLDYIVPQLYWNIGFDKADYAKLLPWWADTVKGTGVQLYVGQADYRIGEAGPWSKPAELDQQLTLNERYGVSGSIHFSAKQVKADRLGAVSRYRDKHYATPALVPTIDRLRDARPPAPTPTGARRDGDRTVLTWRPVDDVTSYAIYRADPEAKTATLVDTIRANDLPSWIGPAASYCVTSLDRANNESEPVLVG